MRRLLNFASRFSLGNQSQLVRYKGHFPFGLCTPSMSCIHGDIVHLQQLVVVLLAVSQGLGKSIHMLGSSAIVGICQCAPRLRVHACCNIFGRFFVVHQPIFLLGSFGLVLLFLLGLEQWT